ncbi:MAG: FeoB-associated Cys-rich membrane protein [Sphaerochaetaceae bacterium]|nr:FeoB-associated Cys-rich membrane protein [Sphaerochaetaceae bacterium]
MNLSTLIVALVILAVVALIIRGIIKDKKKGKNSCGHKCSGCALAGECHNAQKKK